MTGSLKRAPLAPARFPDLPEIAGVRFSTAETGIKYRNRPDVMLALCQPGTHLAGVFTRSKTRSAAVLDCQNKLGADGTDAAAILVNSGNANAFTGSAGFDSVSRVCAAVSRVCDLPEYRVFTASTGVIGEALPDDKITSALKGLRSELSPAKLGDSAHAIMTTDTFAKGSSTQVTTKAGTVTIAGIAKGSGMIAPDMATMLVYIFTDALCSQGYLQDLLRRLTDKTFNCITVDSDTSTSDTLMLAATGASKIDVEDDQAFADGLHQVMLDLAHQVVKDGEGATKFVEVQVNGAATDADAQCHAKAIANSPLVKTAIAGEDPNWGRIVMAIGKSGADADRDKLSICFGDILVAENGWVSPGYAEADAAAYMKQDALTITVDIGLGSGRATVWTCDLTKTYIEINADYRS